MSELEQGLEQSLLLAAEDCPVERFERYHYFSQHEDRIIQALCAHGPVLLKGGRGSGKSALMIEAYRRMSANNYGAIGVYVSLRHLPLLRSTGQEYEQLLCDRLSRAIHDQLVKGHEEQKSFRISRDFAELQDNLKELANTLDKRIVLMFDDVAHIGREASLEEFFGVFRTISSNIVSCKASIYPGVTRFGIRFDVYNDANVFDISRDERSTGFSEFFHQVLKLRYPQLETRIRESRSLSELEVAGFLGRTVVGNMRGFVFACGRLDSQEQIGYPSVELVLKSLAADYYYPLLEELEPKLGVYQPLVATARDLAEILFKHAATQKSVPTLIVHRDIVQSLSKVFEILEYVGFISKREASRAMRSGGRGPRYALNLATLLEQVSPARLTKELFAEWSTPNPDQPVDIHSSSNVIHLSQPVPAKQDELQVLLLPIEKLEQSYIYPYGLTALKLQELKAAGFTTIGELGAAQDEQLLDVPGIGNKWVDRIRSVVGQAVWM